VDRQLVKLQGLATARAAVLSVLVLFFCISDSEFFHFLGIYHDCGETMIGWVWDLTSY
jgi:hypothetical protein